MDAELGMTKEEVMNVSPAGEVESPAQAVKTPVEVPATSEEPEDLDDIQQRLDAAQTPEEKADLTSKRNAAFARLRRERKEARDAETKLLRELADARRAENEVLRRGTETPTKQTQAPAYVIPEFTKPRPRQDDFEDYEEFVAAKDDWLTEKAEHNAYHKAKAEIFEDQRRRETESHLASYESWKRQGSEKYQDFEQVILDTGPVPEVVSQTVREVSNSHEVAYFLGKNPQEFKRIAALPPLRQAMEVVRVSERLASKTVQPKKTTNATPPITPVTPNASPMAMPADMSMEDYIAYMNEKEFGRREAK